MRPTSGSSRVSASSASGASTRRMPRERCGSIASRPLASSERTCLSTALTWGRPIAWPISYSVGACTSRATRARMNSRMLDWRLVRCRLMVPALSPQKVKIESARKSSPPTSIAQRHPRAVVRVGVAAEHVGTLQGPPRMALLAQLPIDPGQPEVETRVAVVQPDGAPVVLHRAGVLAPFFVVHGQQELEVRVLLLHLFQSLLEAGAARLIALAAIQRDQVEQRACMRRVQRQRLQIVALGAAQVPQAQPQHAGIGPTAGIARRQLQR